MLFSRSWTFGWVKNLLLPTIHPEWLQQDKHYCYTSATYLSYSLTLTLCPMSYLYPTYYTLSRQLKMLIISCAESKYARVSMTTPAGIPGMWYLPAAASSHLLAAVNSRAFSSALTRCLSFVGVVLQYTLLVCLTFLIFPRCKGKLELRSWFCR